MVNLANFDSLEGSGGRLLRHFEIHSTRVVNGKELLVSLLNTLYL